MLPRRITIIILPHKKAFGCYIFQDYKIQVQSTTENFRFEVTKWYRIKYFVKIPSIFSWLSLQLYGRIDLHA